MQGQVVLVAVVALTCWVTLDNVASGPGRTGLKPSTSKARSERCLACHEFERGLSHPTGVRGPALAGLPLEEGGRIDCLTCHDERAERTHHLDRNHDAMLRVSGRRLCARCHSNAGEDASSAVNHGLAIARAHLQATRRGQIGGPDAENRSCLGCHDGTVASEPAMFEGSASGWGRLRRNRSHPISVAYGGSALGRRRTTLHPRTSLPPQIRLPGGKIGCVSCHSVYSGIDQMLAVPAKRSRLCLSCHIK